MSNKYCVVIPSYNACKGIIKVISGALEVLPKAKVIVVDDSSPDETAKLVRKKFKGDKRVELIIRNKKSGRGSAVLEGFVIGLQNRNIKYFIEIDADFSHDPKELPRLIKAMNQFDIVIGSRYLRNSKIIGWGLKRIILSRLANAWARIVLGIPISDYTNGFRCYKRRVLESINFKEIKSEGFAVLSETAYLFYKQGFSFGEVPTRFTYRADYGSNFNLGEIKESFLTQLRIRFNNFSKKSS